MSKDAEGVLLDTHALLWFLDGSLTAKVRDKLQAAERAGQLLLSPISVWELALLLRPRSGEPRIHIDSDPGLFLRGLSDDPRLTEAPLTAVIAADAGLLPEEFHKDPADRFLVATARQLNVPLATRDTAILDYAKRGHVRVLPC